MPKSLTRPAKITVTIRAKDGVPAIHWRAEIWYVAGRVEIDIYKDDQCWAESLAPNAVLSTIRLGGSHKRHPYIARKIRALAHTVQVTAAWTGAAAKTEQLREAFDS